MLTSLVLTLTTDRPLLLPPHLGRASHAAFLRLIAESDARLAAELHEPNQLRPFTCSTLWGAQRTNEGLTVLPNTPTFLRFTGLTAEVSAHLRRIAAAPPTCIELDGEHLRVESATLDMSVHAWAGQSSYEEIAGHHLLPKTVPAHQAEIEFISPTAFRSAGRIMPLPLPGLVYGALMEKWNTFAPVGISEEVRRFAEECLAISRCQISTRAVSAKEYSVKVGFVGFCRYTALNRDRYWLSLIQLLTDYAFYAGVGYQTAVGMGQARRAQNSRREPPSQDVDVSVEE